VALLLAVAASGVPLGAVTLPCLAPAHAGAGPSLDRLVAGVCALGALLAWTWMALAVLVASVAALRGSVPRVACVPRLVGLTVAALLGTTVVGSTPALSVGPAAGPGVTALDGLQVPDRALGRPAPLRPRTWTVRPGDCLWSLAAEHLAPDAGLAAIDQAWRAVYGANRGVVGPDPDLLVPGTRLRVPSPTSPDLHRGAPR
jgi:nucleoid-associated protein YgaU